MRLQYIGLVFLLCAAGDRLCSAASGRTGFPQAPDDPRRLVPASWRLIGRVTMNAHGWPVESIAAELARLAGLKLSVAPELAKRRLTVCVDRRPVGEVMDLILRVLAHGRRPAESCVWTRRELHIGTAYELRLTEAGRREEQDALRWPAYGDANSGVNSGLAARNPTVSPRPGCAQSRSPLPDSGAQIDVGTRSPYSSIRYGPISLTEALRRWCAETGRSLAAEIFLKEKRTLRVTSGFPEPLLDSICREFQCDWQKIGPDYVVWSRTWPLDLRADIPDASLRRWIAAREQRDRWELSTILEIGALTDLQIAVVERVVGIKGPLAENNRPVLRILGRLTEFQRKAAFGPQGILVGSPGAELLDLLRRGLHREELRLPVHVKLEQREEGIYVQIGDGQNEPARCLIPQIVGQPGEGLDPVPAAPPAGAGNRN